MPSPFPGMNPYLEQDYVWHDFHDRLIPLLAEMLNPQIVPRYFAKIDEHLYLHEPSGEERRLLGLTDVGVVPTSSPLPPIPDVPTNTAPVQVMLDVAIDIERQPFLEIRDRKDRKLITVLEVLSPSNKRSGPDREQYLTKRGQYLLRAVNLVEIDLLRGRPRMPMRELPACDYCVLVSRPSRWPRADVWPLQLADCLPVIPIPLSAGEPEATLDLQQALHRIYDAAGYAYYIYQGEPEPALDLQQAAWARGFVPAPT